MKFRVKLTRKNYIQLFWTLFAFPFVFLIVVFTLIGMETFGPLPTFEELENPDNNLASQVFTEDGKLLGKFYDQNRTYVDFRELSPNIVDALLATEDIRFHKHSGIDARSLIRVAVKTVLMGKRSGGGSTITQQLAKNLFPRDTFTQSTQLGRAVYLMVTKFKEWITAVKLERNYTKKEIMVMYLNTVAFGGQSYGIKSAAKTYFNSEPDSLKVEEAATLIGMLKAPTRYSPILHPERCKQRRNIVLGQMNKYDYLSNAEFDSLSILPLDLDYKIRDHNQGPATYFRAYLRKIMRKEKPVKRKYLSYESYKEDSTEWANNPLYGWCNKNRKPDGSPYDLFKDGLKIYTTINYKLQEEAEKAVKKHLSEDIQPKFFEEKKGNRNAPFSKEMSQEQIDNIIERSIKGTHRYYMLNQRGLSMDSIMTIFNEPVQMSVFSYDGETDTTMSPLDSILYYKHFLRAGVMSMNPQNGHVKAYVGGPNFRYFKYDHVTQGKRQVGSTIKPFMYTLAMQEGYSPCYKVANVPSTFFVNDTTWIPKNSGPSRYDGEMVSLKWGLAHSVNYISAWLIKQFNEQAVIDIMRKMGIKSHIDPVPSIFLGTADISLYEMVGAYSTFANKGVYIEPLFVTRIEDREGNVITTFKPRQKEAISEQTAYLMINLLQNVVKEGTAIRLRLTYEMNHSIAGKTGTTQNQSDGWFMGVTPNLVSGVWVGGENRGIHFKGITLGQGANMALPIWALYMKNSYDKENLDYPLSREDEFEEPNEFNYILDCEKYERLKKGQSEQREDDFF